MSWLAALLASLSVQSDVAASEVDEAHLQEALQALSAAWLEGDFEQIKTRSDDAVALIEASDCPLRSDAAVAAAMGAIAGRSDGAVYHGGYLYWVASTVDAQLNVLPEAVRELSDLEKTEPGERYREDHQFARSPFRSGALERDCAETVLDPALLLAEPRQATKVFVALRLRPGRRSTPWRNSDLVFAFPSQEGEALAAQIRELDGRGWTTDASQVRRFDPCSHFRRDGDAYVNYVRLCREGAEPL